MPNETDIISKKLSSCYGNIHDNAKKNNFFLHVLLPFFPSSFHEAVKGQKIRSHICLHDCGNWILLLPSNVQSHVLREQGNTFYMKSWRKDFKE